MEDLKGKLDLGEQVLAVAGGGMAVPGALQLRQGLLVATNARLAFYRRKLRGDDIQSFAYEDITSIEFHSQDSGITTAGMGGAASEGCIAFVAAGTARSFEYIPLEAEGKAVVVAAQRQIEQTRSEPRSIKAVPREAGVAEQHAARLLAALRELMDAGVLTDEEFVSKRAQILDRI